MVYMFLTEGFEEVEAIAPLDLLRRAGVSVETVSVNPDRNSVKGSHGIYVMADKSINDIEPQNAEMLIFPGGPGTGSYLESEKLMKILDEAVSSGKRIAAICAAPAKLLGAKGYLKGRNATCYPGLENLLEGAVFTPVDVITDGNFTTSRGMGTAAEFGIELIAVLCGREKALEIRKSVVMP